MGFKSKLAAVVSFALATADSEQLKRLHAQFPAHFLKSTERRRGSAVRNRSKYMPHQGEKEKARRRRQMGMAQ